MVVVYKIPIKATWVDLQDNKRVRIVIFENNQFEKFQKLWKDNKVKYLYNCNHSTCYEKGIYFESNPMDSINVRVGFEIKEENYIDFNICHFILDNIQNQIILEIKE